MTTNIETKNSLFALKDLTKMALFTALICVSAYISFALPLPGSPHLTLLNFMIILVSLLFPLQQSFCIILVWMLLGALGVPVFIGGSAGFGYLVGPWGGYTFTFLLVALALPLIRGKKYGRIRFTIAAIIGVLLIDLIGMLWLKVQAGYDWKAAIGIGFLPFLPLDFIKAVVAAQIVPVFKKVLRSA